RPRSFSQHAAPSVDRVTLQLRLHQVPTVGVLVLHHHVSRGGDHLIDFDLVEGLSDLLHLPSRFATPAIPEMSLLPSTRDPTLITRTLQLALCCIFARQRLRARRQGVRGARAGAVTFVQRFGTRST